MLATQPLTDLAFALMRSILRALKLYKIPFFDFLVTVYDVWNTFKVLVGMTAFFGHYQPPFKRPLQLFLSVASGKPPMPIQPAGGAHWQCWKNVPFVALVLLIISKKRQQCEHHNQNYFPEGHLALVERI